MEAPREQWRRFPERIARNVDETLRLLARHDAKATFFVLGCVAERHPMFVKEIALAGHEVALHGMWHHPVYDELPQHFAEDLRRAKAIVESAAGVAVRGFRAPYFSITRRSLWALPILRDCGFEYDSSIFPIRHFRYGIPGWQTAPHRINLTLFGGTGEIIEIPISTVRIAGLRIPFSGGAYLRMLPQRLVARWIRKLNARNLPAVVYFHPWELDPLQPRIKGPAFFRFRHYTGLRKMREKLEHLLSAFRFTTAVRFCSTLSDKSNLQPPAQRRRI